MKDPKRVLVVVGNMNRGGAETMVMNLFRSLDKDVLTFDFLYFTNKESDYDKEILSLGGCIISVEPKDPKLKVLKPIFRAINLYRHLQNNKNYVAIHSHTFYSTGIHLLIARLAGINNRIAHAHTTSNKRKSVFGSIYKYFATFLINSVATKKLACGVEAGNFLFGKCFKYEGVVLPNAVNFDSYVKDRLICKQKICQELHIPNDTVLVGQIGSLIYTKNHKFSIHLLKYLLDNGIKTHFVFAGVGILKSELIDLCKTLGVENDVSFLGLRTDIPEIVNALDVFLMPSHYEGLPLSIIEAQAAGTKCVVSRNITEESDLGLSLVHFISLDSSLEVWKDAILKPKDISASNVQKRRKVFIDTKYDTKESLKILQDIYDY